MTKDVQEIMDALGLLITACENISDADACGRCPLSHSCIMEDSTYSLFDNVTVGDYEAFLKLSDESFDDMGAYYDDMARKGERDERYIDELYGV